MIMANPTGKEREKAVAICSSASKSNIKAFITMVSNMKNTTVKFIQLPYNDLDSFRLSSEGLDGVIVCHSINNRRFAITDVMDALYDKFLPHVKQVFGKSNVFVIAHDFPWPMKSAGSSTADQHAKIKSSHMESFRDKQPTTFECSHRAIICGNMDKQVDMDKGDREQLEVFVRQCNVQAQSRGPKRIVRVHGFEVDLSDPKILGGLAVCLLLLIIFWRYIKPFLYRTVEVVAYYFFVSLFVPAICRVYHDRGKGPQVFRDDKYWKAILSTLTVGLIYTLVRMNRAGGVLAFLFPVILFAGMVYQRWKQGARKPKLPSLPSRGTFQWSKPPLWKFPYRFWRHFINAAIEYAYSLV
ncbi:uncharacterized protein LOC129256279 [Lytechinus pictus]|uniref:uncharacterized protein LOC129256279 n=1 Tax=Lytechinus pictus TaxID=7653 RepID=UPI0030B9B599